MSCWNAVPQDRPTFTELSDKFSTMLTDGGHHYLKMAGKMLTDHGFYYLKMTGKIFTDPGVYCLKMKLKCSLFMQFMV